MIKKIKYGEAAGKIIIVSLFLFTFIYILVSCNTTEPPDTRKITLTAIDQSCTEAWLEVKTENITLPAELKLFRNDSLVQTITTEQSDTLIYDENLLPNQTYNYHTSIHSINQSTILSEAAAVTTMDTTSHNFTWQTFTFGGDGGSSYFKDVAIINENNIWAVGEIYEDGEQYNAVHWEGSEWELKRILVNFHGNIIFIPLDGIFAFAENDIWLVGSLPIHGNGESWTIYDVRAITNSDLSLTTAWGTSSEDIYFVGRSGSIAHYDGSGWTKIESGTELDIYDIWGDYNEQKGEYEILAVAAKLLHSSDRCIIKIDQGIAIKLNDAEITQPLRSVWFKSNRIYIVAGSGRYKKRELNENIWSTQWKSITRYFTNKVYGVSINNIFMCGAYGEVLHYNGTNWYSCLEKELPLISGELLSISVKENLVCLVGQDNRSGIIHIGEK